MMSAVGGTRLVSEVPKAPNQNQPPPQCTCKPCSQHSSVVLKLWPQIKFLCGFFSVVGRLLGAGAMCWSKDVHHLLTFRT